MILTPDFGSLFLVGPSKTLNWMVVVLVVLVVVVLAVCTCILSVWKPPQSVFNLEFRQSGSYVLHDILNWVIKKMVWVKLWCWNFKKLASSKLLPVCYSLYAFHSFDLFIALNSWIFVKLNHSFKKTTNQSWIKDAEKRQTLFTFRATRSY